MSEFPVELTGQVRVVVQDGEIIQEVKLTPEQAAIELYRFICADLAEGLEYQVSVKVYNDNMKAVGSSRRTESPVNSRKFAEDLYRDTRKIERHHDRSKG